MLSRRYGFNCLRLSELDVYILRECWPQVRAAELLDDPDFCGDLTADGVYRLTLAATGDKEKARKAMADRAKQLIEQGVKP